jgi:hypothetical protein
VITGPRIAAALLTAAGVAVAERAALAEVRYRPPVHRIAEDLLRADRRQSLPGLPAFARRIGVPAA